MRDLLVIAAEVFIRSFNANAAKQKSQIKTNVTADARRWSADLDGRRHRVSFERIGESVDTDGTDAPIEARVKNQYQSPYVLLP